MIKKMIIIGLIVTPTSLFSFEHGKQQNPAVVFSDKVNIRSQPNLKSNIIGQLQIGSKIQILSKTENYETVDGFVDFWYKIQFDDITGYIWGGFIANYYIYINSNNIDCLLMIRNFSEHPYAKHNDFEKFKNQNSNINKADMECKIVQNNKLFFGLSSLQILGEYNIKNMSYRMYHGFDESLSLLKIEYDNRSEYSELGSGEKYLYLCNKSIYPVLEAWSGGEGGTGVKYNIIFPDNRRGKKSKIIIEKSEYEFGESDNIQVTSVTKDEYLWDYKNKIFIKGQ